MTLSFSIFEFQNSSDTAKFFGFDSQHVKMHSLQKECVSLCSVQITHLGNLLPIHRIIVNSVLNSILN